MKIVLISNHNPHFINTNVYREKAIKDLGHDLIFFEDRNFIIPGRLRKKFKVFQRYDLLRLNKKLVKVIKNNRPDLILAVGGHRILASTILFANKMGIKSVLWTSDVPINFDNVINTAPLYDFIFCSGTEAMELLKKNNIKNSIWLPFACDPAYHKPIDLNLEDRKKYSRDVIFVGAFYPNRWEILRNLKEFNLGVWGPGWSKIMSKENHIEGFKDINVNVSEWVKIYSAAKIAIVIHFQNGTTPCYQASPKVFEALACKSFVIVDRQKDVFSLFDDKIHLVGFDDVGELKKKIRYYLDNSDKRKKIANTGYSEVLSKHLYLHRIEKMFGIINN